MKHHDLKIWPVPFAEVRAGRKTFEIRDNDRDYQSGDTVTLREWDPLTHTYTGKREGPFTVGTVIPAGEWGLPENLCVFSLLRSSPVVMPEEVSKAYEAWAEERGVWPRVFNSEAFEAGYSAALRSLSSPAPVEGLRDSRDAFEGWYKAVAHLGGSFKSEQQAMHTAWRAALIWHESRAAVVAPVEAIQLAKDAIEEVENWSGYASEYFQQKHNLTGTLEGLRARLAAAEAEVSRLRGAEPRVWAKPIEHEDVCQCPKCGVFHDTTGAPLYTAPAPDALVEAAKQSMRDHRAQLPSEAADLYGGGCGCPQCERFRSALSTLTKGAKE